MFDRSAFEKYLTEYKRDFIAVIWPAEKYKWQAVQHFQEHWDVNADDFPGMLQAALARTGNLLASAGRFPRRMIEIAATQDPEAVRGMFVSLFDERTDLYERVEAFKKAADFAFPVAEGRSHFQDENSITTYLWLRYPDKHYVYKWSLARDAVEAFAADYPFKKGDYANNVRDFMAFYDEICRSLQLDDDVRGLLDTSLTGDCYPDPELKTLTIDFGYYVGQRMKSMRESESWWPSKDEYDPGLSVEEWKTLLENPEVFDVSSLQVVACFKDIGGAASCSAVAAKYGRSAEFYNVVSTKTAARVLKASTAGAPPNHTEGGQRRWPVLFTGRETLKDEAGTFVWRLRDELSQALDRIDLGSIELYDGNAAVDTGDADEESSPNHWLLIASPDHFRFSDLEVGGVERWTLFSENGTKRRIFRNFENVQAGDLVIGYESTPVKQIVALGRFTGSSDGTAIPFEKTEGLDSPIDFKDMKDLPELAEMEGLPSIQGSLFKLTGTQYDAVVELIRDSNPVAERQELPRYSKQEFLAEVFTTEEQYDSLVGVLRRKKNVILQGAPGVGKTFAAKRLAWSMMGEEDSGRIEFVQFHQNYSYEDFMLGYKSSAP